MGIQQPNDVQVVCKACGARLLIRRGRPGIVYKCSKCAEILDVVKPPDIPVAKRALEQQQFNVIGAANTKDEYQVSPAVDSPPPNSVIQRNDFPVICPHCRTRMYATVSQVGQSLECPDCRQSLVVPAPPPPKAPPRLPDSFSAGGEYAICHGSDQPAANSIAYRRHFSVICPLCHTRLTATEDQVGQSLTCPDCRRSVVVPPPPAPKPKRTQWSEGDGIEIAVEAPCERAMIVVPLHDSETDDAPREPAVRQAPPLPRRPLASGVFSFPCHFGVWQQWLGYSVWLAVVLILVHLDASLLTGPPSLASWIAAVFWTIISALIGTGCLIAGSSVLLAIVGDTSEGVDRIENWPESIFSSLRDAWLIVNGLAMAAMPGAAIGSVLGLVIGFGWLVVPLSVFALFPILLLSMLINDSALIPFSRHVWRSLTDARPAWITFYLESFVVVGAAGGIAWVGWWKGEIWSLALAAPVVVAALLIYFRLLGRLAWICAVRLAEVEEAEEVFDETEAEHAVEV